VYIATNFQGPLGGKIERDIECPGCGYNLRGLRYGAFCPECGLGIGKRPGDDASESMPDFLGFWGRVLWLIEPKHTPGITSSLIDAPLRYLHSLSLACRFMQIALILLAILPITAIVVIKFGLAQDKAWAMAAIASLLPAGLWASGVWVMAAPRRMREMRTQLAAREWRTSRIIVRVTQCAWLPASAMLSIIGIAALQSFTLPVPSKIWTWVMAGFAIVGFLGLSALGLYASRIADWANDNSLSDRLRLASLGVFFAPPIIVSTVLAALFFDTDVARAFFAIIGLLACIIPIAWLIQLVVATMQFISLANWAQINADTILERDQRFAENAARNLARVAREHQPPNPIDMAPPIPLAGDLPIEGDLPLVRESPLRPIRDSLALSNKPIQERVVRHPKTK